MIPKIEIDTYLVAFAVLTSILSFSSNTSISGICSALMLLFWPGAIGLMFFRKKIEFNNTIKYMIFTYVFFFFFFKLMYHLGFYPSGGSGQAGFLIYCVMFYIVGYNFPWKNYKALNTVLVFSFIGYFILMLTTFTMLNEIEDSVLWSKNQLGQMLGIAVIFEVFILPRVVKSKYMKLAMYACSIPTLIALMDIHSRTPVIALTVVTIVNFVLKKNKTNNDYWMAFGVLVLVGFLIYCLGGIEFLKELFEIDSDTNLSSAEGLNDMTSGRLDGYAIAFKDFAKSPILGIGAYAYMDNFVVCTLRTGGIVLAVFILPFVYVKLFSSFKNANIYLESYNKDENVNVIMYILRCFSLFFFVISLMEGYPPLGPSTSVFMLWLFMGMAESIMTEPKAFSKEIVDPFR